jgi:hypothetical protein
MTHTRIDQLRSESGEDVMSVNAIEMKKQFTESGLKSLIWIWVTFLLPSILINSNKANSAL